MNRLRSTSCVVAALLVCGAASADVGSTPKVTVINLTIGTNKIITTSGRMARCEVNGTEFCRVKCQENGNSIELFPYKNGKTVIWIYDAIERRLVEEIRVNVCTRELQSLYDQAADRYREIEGLVVDIDSNKLVFTGQIFSMEAYQELQVLKGEGKYAVDVTLHPYVNAVLSSSPSALGPMPGQEEEEGDGASEPATP